MVTTSLITDDETAEPFLGVSKFLCDTCYSFYTVLFGVARALGVLSQVNSNAKFLCHFLEHDSSLLKCL
jgi:hypothetical protein